MIAWLRERFGNILIDRDEGQSERPLGAQKVLQRMENARRVQMEARSFMRFYIYKLPFSERPSLYLTMSSVQ